METSRNVFEQPMKNANRFAQFTRFVLDRYSSEAPLYMSEHFNKREDYTQLEFDFEDIANMGERPEL